jgi:hypothetical protein
VQKYVFTESAGLSLCRCGASHQPVGQLGSDQGYVLQFGRIHRSLRARPAMEAGIVDHVWSSEKIINLIK